MGIYYTFYTQKNEAREGMVERVAEILRGYGPGNVCGSDVFVKVSGISAKTFYKMTQFLPFEGIKKGFELSDPQYAFSAEEVDILRAFFKDIPFIIFYHDCNDECHLYSHNSKANAHFCSYDIRFWENTPEHVKNGILEALLKVNVNFSKLREIF